MSSAAAVPALLTMPHYAGTLATARHLGERGVEVVIATDRLLAPAFWSRHVARRTRSPSVAQGPASIAAWLCRYGQKNAGTVLYPTSDDMAWVIARHADQLRQHFRLYAPPLSALRALLDKSELYDVCLKSGVPAPKTWMPTSESELASLCDGERSLLLKPRAQMFFSGGKGERITDLAHAVRTWRIYRSARYAPGVLDELPSLDLPLVQEYEPSATQGTYSVSGIIEPSGRISISRASTKLLQTTRVGIGMCFVASEVNPSALRSIAEIARRVGYFGVFEVEFVMRDGEYLLIDFNPRYYGQMGFDIARGAHLPWIIHQAALGQTSELDVGGASTASSDAPTLYCDRVALAWWLGTALASGAMSPREAVDWYHAMDERSHQGIDACWRRDDPLPTLIKLAAVASGPLRNPMSFLRSLRESSDFYQSPLAQ